MLPSIVGEAIGALLLAITIVALATLLQRARRQRADAELAVAFEREIASDLLEQADALDRLVAAVAGLQDDLDEQRVLDRLASATRQLLQADAALVVETSEDGLLVCAAHDAIDPTLVPPPLTRAGNVAETLQAGLAAEVCSVAMGAQGLGPADLAVVRRSDPPFSPLELAQLRVLADFGSRARQNGRLYTLARSLRAQAEERERERARLSDRLLTAEEQERRRLSLALHDGPQQTIAGVGLILEAALADLGDEEHRETSRVVRLAIERTRGIVRDLRRLTFALEPITLRDHGFGAAFGELAAQTGEAHRVVRHGRRCDRRRARATGPGLPVPHRAGGARERREACERVTRVGARPPPARRQHRVRGRRRRQRDLAGGARPARPSPGSRCDARARIRRRCEPPLRADARRWDHRAPRGAAAVGRATGRGLSSRRARPQPRRTAAAREHDERGAGDDEHHGCHDLVQPQRPDLVRGVDPQALDEEAACGVQREVQAEQRPARQPLPGAPRHDQDDRAH